MASIRKRTLPDSGRTVWLADYRDGSGARRFRQFATRRAADDWMIDARHQVATGVHTPDSASITVAAASAIWIARAEAESLEASTIRQYREHVDLHITPLIGGKRLSRLTVPRVEQFRDDLLATRSRALAAKVLTSLKGIVKEAQRRGLVSQNVAREVSIRTSARHRTPVVVPTKDQIKALLEAVAPRWRPLIVTATFTGLRASELRGLAWEHIDFAARLIRVQVRADRFNRIGPLKSASARRDVPMSPMTLNVLREWRLACPKGELDLVFPTRAGKIDSSANIWSRALRPAEVRAGIAPLFGLHALRHFFASWLIDQGFGPKRVQQLLGHSGIQITLDTYTHLWPAEDDHERFAAGELALVGGGMEQKWNRSA
jgi:integrase